MVDVDVFVWHDSDGNITAVGRPHPSFADRVRPVAPADRSVLHLRVPEHQIEHLCESHCIDVVKHTLMPRSAPATRPKVRPK
jgi:hypothetical protein